MEPVIEYLKRRLRECGPAAWDDIAAESGASRSLLRKIAYGDRENPTIKSIQPLLDYFAAVERGEKAIPERSRAAE